MNSVVAVIFVVCAADPAPLPAVDMPRVLDDRLQLELVCREPDIVTPTGLTIDAKGRILVIENHTHQRPAGYQGPPHDRILLIDPNEKPAKPRVWFEGTKNTMNLAKAPDDSIYVATRSEIFRLCDTDGDDKADERTEIAHLETTGNYPHNGLSGFAFQTIGDKTEVFFGLGENLGADYKLVGSDGSSSSGGGEGGNVYACQLDGSKVRRVATGFWNPFHVAFGPLGNLFAVDNDPDSRPPCRLIHVVEGGDYGFKFRHGRKGTHPFTAWNGELPGTLPMVSGTGEAPCAVLHDKSMLENPQADSIGSLLVTSWGDHRIESYRLIDRGESFTATMRPLVIGGENFRPVGMAGNLDTALYFSDWVDKSYPVHGKGRIWKLSIKREETHLDAGGRSSASLFIPDDRSDDVRRAELRKRFQALVKEKVADPFAWQSAAAVLSFEQAKRPALDKSTLGNYLSEFVDPHSADTAIWAAVAAREANAENAKILVPYLLKHDEPRVRLLGVIWAGDGAMVDQRVAVENVLSMPGLTRELFEATLAALELIDTAAAGAKPSTDPKRPNSGDTYVLKVLNDPKSSPSLRQFALKALRPDHPELKFDLLKRLTDDADATVRVEAIRTLRERTGGDRDAVMRAIAADAARSEAERAEAAIGLSHEAPARVLPNHPRPVAERIATISAGGDPVKGERLFFHPRVASCYRCHEYNGRGATIGPDLTTFGRGASRERILQSMLEPSREIAPHYVPWIIETKDGRTLNGLYIGEEVKGEHRYADAQGKIFLVHPNDIEHREAAKQSIMPADFGKTLTDDELRDLAAFLLR